MVDLHIHSNLSDGDKSVKELIDILKQKKIELFSITDHDSVESINILNNEKSINYIPGVEMSSIDNNVKMHILGYGIKSDGYVLNECQRIKSIRKELVQEIIENLIKDGYIFNQSDIDNLLNNDSSCIGKIDISKLLLKYGYVSTIKEAFYGILKNYKIGPKIRCNSKEIIFKIKEDNGIAVLAHPFEIVREEKVNIDEVVNSLYKYGLDGLEVFTTKHSKEETKYMLELCKKKKLLISGGSDYHGISKPNIELGLDIKGDEISDRIKKKAIKH